MAGKRLIRLSSRALGHPVRMRVYVYDDASCMRRDAVAFNGNTSNADPEVIGVTQAWTDQDGRAALVTMRLARQHLTTEVVVHEVHHATTALYGATLPDTINRVDYLHHYNEPYAHLHGQLVAKLVNRLHELGYYDTP